eukprot:TRINITY_DN14781_c0_g1_i1.p1 TRINITY_DN14781_c0_g1~~TRINITY_DN14781_c0_g1_i1.p1  ORF type:complete len:801 (+),score=96.42 TRINITY_DN14781_c0_g1_i1:314-2716(+)
MSMISVFVGVFFATLFFSVIVAYFVFGCCIVPYCGLTRRQFFVESCVFLCSMRKWRSRLIILAVFVLWGALVCFSVMFYVAGGDVGVLFGEEAIQDTWFRTMEADKMSKADIAKILAKSRPHESAATLDHLAEEIRLNAHLDRHRDAMVICGARNDPCLGNELTEYLYETLDTEVPQISLLAGLPCYQGRYEEMNPQGRTIYIPVHEWFTNSLMEDPQKGMMSSSSVVSIYEADKAGGFIRNHCYDVIYIDVAFIGSRSMFPWLRSLVNKHQILPGHLGGTVMTNGVLTNFGGVGGIEEADVRSAVRILRDRREKEDVGRHASKDENHYENEAGICTRRAGDGSRRPTKLILDMRQVGVTWSGLSPDNIVGTMFGEYEPAYLDLLPQTPGSVRVYDLDDHNALHPSVAIRSAYAHQLSRMDRTAGPLFLMMWDTEPKTLMDRNRRTVESIFFHHPDADIKVFSNTLPLDYYSYIPRKSGDIGRNPEAPEITGSVTIVRFTWRALFRDTPLDSWYHNGAWRNQRKYLGNNLANAFRLAALYRYGGIYMDFDMVLLKPITDLVKIGNVIGLEKEGKVNNAFIIANQGNRFLFEAMNDFAAHYDGNRWGHQGPKLLSRVYEKEFVSDLTLMSSWAFFAILPHDENVDPEANWLAVGCDIHSLAAKTHELEKWEKFLHRHAYVIHYWNKLTKNFALGRDSILYHALRDNSITPLTEESMKETRPYGHSSPPFKFDPTTETDSKELRALFTADRRLQRRLEMFGEKLGKGEAILPYGASKLAFDQKRVKETVMEVDLLAREEMGV